MKKVLYTLFFVLYLSVITYAQGLGIANALTNLDQDYAYGTTVALYGSFDVGSTYSGSAWEALNHRVITDFSGNDTTNFNRILFIGATQINIVLYSTDNTNTLFPNPYAFNQAGGGNNDPKSVTIQVQKLVSGTWTTYKSVTRNVRIVDPAPKVNTSTNVITGLLYDPSGNYIGFHDGTTSSPIYTGSAIDANRNFFVPYVTGALYSAEGYNSCNPLPLITKYVSPYTTSSGNIPSGDIYGGVYFNSGYEGVQQLNFRVPSNANNLKLVFSINGNCSSYYYSYDSTDTKLSMGSWY